MIEDKNKVGRKWFDGRDEEKTVAKLKEAWGWGCNDTEAANWAEVSKFSVSRYLDANPSLKEIRNRLIDNPIIKARKTVTDKIGDSYGNAMDYLKRKRKSEFGDNIDVTSDNKPIPLLSGKSNGNNSNQSDK